MLHHLQPGGRRFLSPGGGGNGRRDPVNPIIMHLEEVAAAAAATLRKEV